MLTAIFVMTVNASENYNFEEDKQKHFLFSSILAIGSESILETYNKNSLAKHEQLNGIELITYATLIGVIPGLTKEIVDANTEGNTWSNADLTYDLAGAFFGSTLSYSIHRLFDNNDYNVNLTLNNKYQKFYLSYKF